MSQMSPEEEEAVQAELERLQQEAMVRPPRTVISAHHRPVVLVHRADPLSRQYQPHRIHSPSRCRTCPSRSPPPRRHQPNVSPPHRLGPLHPFPSHGIPRSVESFSSSYMVRL